MTELALFISDEPQLDTKVTSLSALVLFQLTNR